MSTEDPDRPEYSDSDREWFAALSGRTPIGQGGRASREGHALRAALEVRRRELDVDPEGAAATDEASTEEQLKKMLVRARAEGAFDRASPAAAPAPSNVIEFPWWRRRRAILALAASVLLGTVVLRQVLDQADYPLPPQTYGTEGVQRVRDAQPRAAAEALAARLREAGLKPGLYQRDKTYIVDVQLMAGEVDAAKPAFAPLSIRPLTGSNRVEVTPR